MSYLCRWLEVSRSGFYAWEKREASQRQLEDQALDEKITQIYWASEGRYGSPRIHKALQAQGVYVSRKRVARLMKASGLVGRVVKVTQRQPNLKRFFGGENLRLELEAPTAINQVWVLDVTYLKVSGKWTYLATVMDLYSRRIIGWSLSHTRTSELTGQALRYALKKRSYPEGVIFHTDRGVEYKGQEFQKLIKQYDFKHSFNRPGRCTDNAHMESFFHSLKTELIRGNVYKTMNGLRRNLAKYINQFYNAVRLHSGIDYLSPMEYEQRLA